jgi:hypothetical protein
MGKLPFLVNSCGTLLQNMEQTTQTTQATQAMQELNPETLRDFEYPQREAAFFYGLFLRGHAPEKLRRDIDVPPDVLARWEREAGRAPEVRSVMDRILEYRRNVLAIFDSLVFTTSRRTRLQ